MTIGPDNDMMFSVMVVGVNLTAVPRLFDVTVGARLHQSSTFINETSIVMEQCERRHYAVSS